MNVTDAGINSQYIRTVKYCFERCARHAENKRYYTSHRDYMINRIKSKRKNK